MPTIDSPSDFGDSVATKGGPELEGRLRAAGVFLPTGVSGADLLRAVFQGMFQDPSEHRSAVLATGLQFGLTPIMEIIRTLEDELPGGMSDARFNDALLHKVRVWAATKRNPGEAASA